MFDIDKLPPLREIIKSFDLQAVKKLGQNFLLDLNLTDKIVRNANIVPGASIIEIGPGPGGLTRSLLKTNVSHVLAIEIDTRAVRALQGLYEVSNNRLRIINIDALSFDIHGYDTKPPRQIISNLPYNIATPLLIKWLRQIKQDPLIYESMTLMFQKEVAERLVAAANSKTYGRLSIMAQWLCTAQIVLDLPPSAFTPPPKVSSAVVYFKPRVLLDSSGPSFETMERVTSMAFNQRRKMVRSSLKPYIEILEKLKIDTTKRAENLEVADYVRIAKALQ